MHPAPGRQPLPDGYLTVQAYGNAEAAACSELPNRIIEEARPFLFTQLGYPTRIDDDGAGWRFADTMHETRFEGDVRLRLGGLTSEELDLCLTVNRAVTDLTERLYGRRIVATSSLVRALNVFRHIRALYEPGSTVLEIGPGSGYLGALLMLNGYRYVATDITQGFYIYQSHLWRRLFGDRFRELASDGGSLRDAMADGGVLGVHAPWWVYMTLFREESPPTVDVVTANHMLCEMTTLSRRYTMKMARRMLDGSGRSPSFLFEGWGYDLVTSTYEAYRGFRWNGFAMRFTDDDIVLFEPTTDAFQDDPAIREMVWAYMRARGPKEPPRPLPQLLVTGGGDWAARISAFRDAQAQVPRHDFPAVVDAFRTALDVDDLRSPDELFYAFLGHAC